ncbi:MAG: hypothetical protein KJ726_10360 [Verrucomicrobia bacterium]|nr:hypothetical protein [Verrucomicrobiota bacterium]
MDVRRYYFVFLLLLLITRSEAEQSPSPISLDSNRVAQVDLLDPALSADSQTNKPPVLPPSNEQVGVFESWRASEDNATVFSRRHVNVQTRLFADGRAVDQVQDRRYTELAGGLNHQTASGQWALTTLEQEVRPDGGITYSRLSAELRFAPNANRESVVEIRHEGGQVARSSVAGLSYYDSASGHSYVFA